MGLLVVEAQVRNSACGNSLLHLCGCEGTGVTAFRGRRHSPQRTVQGNVHQVGTDNRENLPQRRYQASIGGRSSDWEFYMQSNQPRCCQMLLAELVKLLGVEVQGRALGIGEIENDQIKLGTCIFQIGNESSL